MDKEENFWQRLAARAEMTGEPLPTQSIIEIAGEHRVLIENHLGVYEYSGDQVCVKTGFGAVRISGCGLHLSQMTREHLTVCGKIETVGLIRRNRI